MEEPLPPDVCRLIEQLKSPDPIERIRTVQGLAKLDCRDESVRLALEEIAWSDPELDIRSEARYALGKLGLPIYPADGWISPKLAYAPPGTDGEKLNLRQRFLALSYGLSPKTVAQVLYGSVLIPILITFLIFIIAMTGKIEINKDMIDLYAIDLVKFFFLTFIFGAIFVFVAPVRCDHEGCHERMHRAWIKDNGFRLTYKCDRCGYTYDTKFSFGGDSIN